MLEKAGRLFKKMHSLGIVLFFHCTMTLLGILQASVLPEDWRDRIDPSVLESRESQVGLCDLDEETSVEEGAFASAVEFTGKLAEQNYWPNGGKGIAYLISPHFGSRENQKIRRALDIISRRTHGCITFVMRTSQTDFLFFKPHPRVCQSRVGRRLGGGPHNILLAQGCVDIEGIIQHEILHALGLFHEQNRPDRDDYVDIFLENIKPNFRHNFRKLSEMEVYDTFYDLNSIMHYGAYDFALVEINVTIVPKKTVKKALMGQRRHMSILDVAKIQKAYGCDFDDGNDETDSTTTHSPTTNRMTTRASPFTKSSSVSIATTPNDIDEDISMPVFFSQPMQQEQCDLSFRPKCGREHYSSETCTETKGLEIDCKGLTTTELSQMVADMARPPIRPIRVDIEDGRDTLTERMFRPIRQQIIGLELWTCESTRSTSKLVSLKLNQMLHLEFVRCRDLDIKKGDFRSSRNLRMVLFRDSTIEQLEEKTFTNLPKLGLLSMEYERRRGEWIPEDQKSFIKALHCGCHFKWLRKWFIRTPSLITAKRQGELYAVEDAFKSPAINRKEIYRPFNCETHSVDFTQRDFSTPARLHLNHNECSN